MRSLLSAAIKAGLDLKGITQSHLAEKVNVSDNTVSSWVQDKSLPDKESRPALQELFGWSDGKFLMLLEDWHLNVGGDRRCRIAGPDFVAWKYGGDYELLLEEIIALDEETIEGSVGEHEGSPAQWAPIFKNNPDTWRLLVRDGKIVGYWQFHCLKKEVYDHVANGQLTDSELTLDMIVFPEVEGKYYAHLPVVTTLPEVRGIQSMRLITSSLAESIRRFAVYDVLFEALVAVAFTAPGQQLCEKLGLSYKMDHPKREDTQIGRIYEIRGQDVPSSYWGRDTVVRDKYSAAFGRR